MCSLIIQGHQPIVANHWICPIKYSLVSVVFCKQLLIIGRSYTKGISPPTHRGVCAVNHGKFLIRPYISESFMWIFLGLSGELKDTDDLPSHFLTMLNRFACLINAVRDNLFCVDVYWVVSYPERPCTVMCRLLDAHFLSCLVESYFSLWLKIPWAHRHFCLQMLC